MVWKWFKIDRCPNLGYELYYTGYGMTENNIQLGENMNAVICDVEGLVFYCVGESEKIDDLLQYANLHNDKGADIEALCDRIIGSKIHAFIQCKNFKNILESIKIKRKLIKSKLYINGDLYDGATFLLNPQKTSEVLGIENDKIDELIKHYTEVLAKAGILFS